VVTLIELAHGAARADTPQRKGTRQQFIQELLTALPIYPVTVSLALRVGQIDGESQSRGIRVPFADLLRGDRESPAFRKDPRLVGVPVLIAETCNQFAIT
jgi:hypothetical protein